MLHLYDLAAKRDGLVLSTDNYTESMLGFFTLHGDHNDFGPIQNLWKTEVYEMSRFLVKSFISQGKSKEAEALKECIEAVPTPGLGITDGDLDELGADSYEEVDELLMTFIKGELKPDHPVIARHLNSEWKRNWPVYISRENILSEG